MVQFLGLMEHPRCRAIHSVPLALLVLLVVIGGLCPNPEVWTDWGAVLQLKALMGISTTINQTLL